MEYKQGYNRKLVGNLYDFRTEEFFEKKNEEAEIEN